MATVDKRTGLEKFKEQYEENNGLKLNPRNLNKAVDRVIGDLSRTPQKLDEFRKNIGVGGELDLIQTRRLNMSINMVETGSPAISGSVAKKTQFAGLLTYASVANSALNVLSRFTLGAGAYNAQVGGRVIEFENQQKKWENLRRTTLLAGSAASTGYFGYKLAAGAAVSPATALAVGLAFTSQIARIYNENRELSGERARQDKDSRYHEMAYGRIVTRGNR